MLTHCSCLNFDCFIFFGASAQTRSLITNPLFEGSFYQFTTCIKCPE